MYIQLLLRGGLHVFVVQSSSLQSLRQRRQWRLPLGTSALAFSPLICAVSPFPEKKNCPEKNGRKNKSKKCRIEERTERRGYLFHKMFLIFQHSKYQQNGLILNCYQLLSVRQLEKKLPLQGVSVTVRCAFFTLFTCRLAVFVRLVRQKAASHRRTAAGSTTSTKCIYCMNYAWSLLLCMSHRPTKHLKTQTPPNPLLGEFYVLQKRGLPDYVALNLLDVVSDKVCQKQKPYIHLPDWTFSQFQFQFQVSELQSLFLSTQNYAIFCQVAAPCTVIQYYT